MVLKTSETNLLNWDSALYLTERKIDDTTLEKDGEQQVQQWCGRTGLPMDLLHFRLKEDGLNYKDFLNILGGSSKPFEYRETDWFRTLEDIYSLENELTDEDISQIDQSQSPFYSFMVPFMNWARAQMLAKYKIWQTKQPNLPFNISIIIPILMKAVHQHVHAKAGRTLVYELNVARLSNQLVGNTPEARFEFFVNKKLNGKQNIYQLLQQYPTLARLLAEGTMNLVNSIHETISRFFWDYPAIVQMFEGDFEELLHIDTMEGDYHNHGRSVMIFHFSSGARLVYKPRSLATDLHFQDFLTWMNEKGSNPQFQTLKILSRLDYGWEEWVEYKECQTKDQINRFYQRMGSYLMVLYLLYATDFHLENVLASGEHPFLIDVEALFQNIVPLTGNEESGFFHAVQILNQSILRSGMLPVSLFKSGDFRGVEVSAIGGKGGQELPRPVYRYENIGTDEMKLVKTKGFLKGGRNRPKLKGEEIKAEDYIEGIVQGFQQAYHLLTHHREELLAEEGPLMAFADDTVRAVVRNTYNYSTFLDVSLHPNYLKDGLMRVQLFDFLWRAVEHQPSLIRLVSSETTDMLGGDIPMFVNRVNSRNLWDIRGKTIDRFYQKSAMELVMDRLQGLDTEDCERQIQFLRLSMSTISEKRTLPKMKHITNIPVKIASREQFIHASVQIGDQLLQQAVWGKDSSDICWIGLSSDESEQLLFAPMDDCLYDGVLGMALYFAYLSKESGEERFHKAARAALRGAYRYFESGMSSPSISAFNGLASRAYVLSQLAVVMEEPEWMDEAIKLLKKAEPLIETDKLYDLLAGSAGLILVALRLYRLTRNKEVLQMAEKAANHLLANAKPLKKGIGWAFENQGCVPIGGLAHGAAGFTWALMEIAKISGDDKYLEAAQQSLAFERTLFDKETGNWRDARPEKFRHSKGTSPIQWCHGAAGIAMGRIMSFQLYPDEQLREEITTALNTTFHNGFGVSHCLCHGDLGNIDAMLLAGEIDEYKSWKEIAQACGTRVLMEAEKSGWICGIPQGLTTPGLMTGMAGIGYGLLRLASPETVPSVLTLGGTRLVGRREISNG
ncbi:type 2 lanthipeptide synthetase LanM family protein [Neobacillus cucumis]|uniref:type 2 lanthipeptide synthetase LanM family protein n=1 Tax=Neobacillus cucumis TaxID=1740721 RepID=UPI00196484DB|nr:type 2 lanthipeptide synthetase LanM family protein [Neobacillus cucumis]MBM7652794.1 type 2 lantibiotic biosynthesis protein LanM [Neobacillus cucumis]